MHREEHPFSKSWISCLLLLNRFFCGGREQLLFFCCQRYHYYWCLLAATLLALWLYAVRLLSFIYDFTYFSSAGLLWFDGFRFCCQLLYDDLASNHETPPPFFCQIDTRLACLYYDALPFVFFCSCRRIKVVPLCCTCCLHYACAHLVVQYTLKNGHATMIALSRAPTRAANSNNADLLTQLTMIALLRCIILHWSVLCSLFVKSSPGALFYLENLC